MRSPGNTLATGLVVLGLTLATGLSTRAADETAIRFVKPRNLAIALGPTPIQLFVSVPQGASVRSVELLVDGRPLTTLDGPPWSVSWNAGDGSRGHTLQAILTLTDGTMARATARTSAMRIDQFETVDLVNLYLVVRRSGGQYVTDLKREDFRVLENEREQTLERFANTHKPLRVGIVLDTSLSMAKGQRLEKAKRAALEFLDVLEPKDEGLVVSFNDGVIVTQELAADKRALATAIQNDFARGGTALYDAIWKTSRLLEDFDGRRVMVLLSDGRDEAANGMEPGSLHTLDEALEQALRSEVMVFPIGLGRNLEKEYVRRWDSSGLSNLDTSTSVASILRRLADNTGGRAVISSNAGRLRTAFQEIADDLRHQYSMAYVSTDPTHDGKWRSVEVLVPGRSLEIITRKGYYAEKPRREKRARH